jgi:hypothetical protein
MYAKQNYNLLHFTASEVSNIDFTTLFFCFWYTFLRLSKLQGLVRLKGLVE